MLALALKSALAVALGVSVIACTSHIEARADVANADHLEACSIAKTMVSEYLRRAPPEDVISEEPPLFPTTRHSLEALTSGWSAAVAPRDLLVAIRNTKLTSAFGCPQALRVAKDAGLRIVSADERDELLRPPATQASPLIHQISTPLISQDQSHAIVYVSSFRAGVGGSDRLMLMTRNGSAWSVVSVKLLGIS
jgi:hypothetical protein